MFGNCLLVGAKRRKPVLAHAVEHGVERVGQLGSPSVIQRHHESHAGVARRLPHRVGDIAIHRFRQIRRAPDHQQADIVSLDRRQLALQVFAQQTHQKIHFRPRASPVFQRERIQRQAWQMQSRARLDDLARHLHARAMPRHARQMPPFGPAAIAIHDDGHMMRQALAVELFQQLCFLAAGRLPEVGVFHGAIFT